nr:PREDICTED: slit homolog 1 protein-like [Bemisia tabaci]XP_018904806.1 PREDICTED: slit homolog 1 protein-like [Bemisia tabaci]
MEDEATAAARNVMLFAHKDFEEDGDAGAEEGDGDGEGGGEEEELLERGPGRGRKLRFKVSMIWVAVPLLLWSAIAMGRGSPMCPTGCTCRDDVLEASCTHAQLEYIPIQLNPDLQVIHLRGNLISCTPGILCDFSIYSKLQHIDMSENKLQSVGSRNFQYQTHLHLLNISHNQISAIGRDAFKGLRALKLLDLSNNNIERIDNHAFNDTVSLETLNLTRNRIVSLHGDSLFRNLPNLQVLILERNELVDVPSEALKSLPNHAQLSSLLLSYNLIQTLNETSFPFPQLSNLTELLLAYNVISDIHKSAFNSLRDLTSLDLSFNNLTQIPTQQLSKLTKLSTLDLSGNELSDVGAVSFKSLFQLRHLVLSRMPRLVSIDARAFVDNIQLENIRISENLGLERIPPRIFHGNPNLNRIEMRGNSLRTLDASHFPLDRLKVLDISENPLHCNCSLLWLWVLVRQQMKASAKPAPRVVENITAPGVKNPDALKITLHNLKCTSPEELKMKMVGEIPEDTVRCETSWLTIAMLSATSLALLTVLLIGLFLIISGKRMSCGKSKSHETSGSLESRGVMVNSTRTPVLTLYPDKAYTSMLMNGYLMQPESPSAKQNYGSMEHWDPFPSLGTAKKVGNDYTNEIPRAKKVPHIVYV